MADGRKYFIQIHADTNLGDVVKSLNKITHGLSSATKSSALFIGKTALAVKVAKELADAMIIAYNSSIQFNKGLANVATLLPKQVGRIEQLKKGLLDLSSSSAKPLDDLTNGMYEVISAFEDSADTMGRMNAVTKASMAGQATTIDALQLLSAVGKGFNDTSAKMLDYISDLSFETVRLGQTNFPQLAHAIQIVTANSTRMGVSMEEMFNVFATMTGVTGNADIVATQLRSALASLADPTEQMTGALQHFGYSSGEAMVRAEGFGNTVKKLVEYAPQMGTTVEKLFQRVEAVNLVTAMSTNSWDTYVRKLESLNSASGATNLALAEITSGINQQGFQLEQINQRYKIFLQQIGQGIQKESRIAISLLNKMFLEMIGGDATAESLKETTHELARESSEYSNVLKELKQAIEENDEASIKFLQTQRGLLGIDISQTMDNLTTKYNKLERSIEKNNKSIEQEERNMTEAETVMKNVATSLGINVDETGNWIAELTTLAGTSKGDSETLQKLQTVLGDYNLNVTTLLFTIDNFNSAMLENQRLTNENTDSLDREKEIVDLLAKAYNEGELSTLTFATLQEDLKKKVVEASKALKEQNKTLAEESGGDTSRTTLSRDENIRILKLRVDIAGASGDELKKLTADYNLAMQEIRNDIIDVKQTYANNIEIQKALTTELVMKEDSLTAEYERQKQALIDVKKEAEERAKIEKESYTQNLKTQLELVKAEDEEERLRIEKVNAIKALAKDEKNDTNENRQLIVDYYEYQISKVKEKQEAEAQAQAEKQRALEEQARIERENYTQNLENQLFELQNEDKILALQREQQQALDEIKDTENDSVENQNLIKSIYEEKIAKAKEELELEKERLKLEAERQKIERSEEFAKDITSLPKMELEFGFKLAENGDIEQLSAYDRYVRETQVSLAELSVQLLEAKTNFGDNSDQVGLLEAQIAKLEEELEGTSEGWVNFSDGFKKAMNKTSSILDGMKDGFNELFDTIKMFYENKWQLEEEDIDNQQKQYDEDEKKRDKKRESLKQAYDADSISREEYNARKKELDDASLKQEKKIKEKENALKKKQFEFDKQVRIANSIMDTASGVAKALTLPFPLNLVQAGVIGGMGIAQTVAIQQQQMPQYAQGAYELPQNQVAQVHKGEMIVPRKFADDFRNKAKRGFGEGGDIINISGNTFVGYEGLDELLIQMEERKKVLRSRGTLD